MSFQAINLGTPNNNDGDSLYAGGTKINANFSEIYVALAGSTANTIRIDLNDTGLVTGNSLRYSAVLGKFVSVSSTSLRSMGYDGATNFYLTNDEGEAGVDGDLVGPPNSALLHLNGRRMFTLRARTTGVTTATRGELHFGLGQTAVTSLSIYTSGVVVRGLYGLEIYVASGEDTAAYTTLLTSSSNGVRLYGTPVLDVASGAVKAITDSSNSIAHTGFVKAWTERYASSSFSISVNNGIVGGGNLTASTRTIGIDPYFYPHLCQGFLYSYNNVGNTLSVTPGVAVHYSYGTAGETPINNTSVLSIVASSSTLTKNWTTGWSVGGSAAIIDGSVATNTWYYIYLIAENATGAPDWLLSSQRTIGNANSALNGLTTSWSVVRRLGCVRTDNSANPIPLPFNINKVADSTIHMSWGRLAGVGAINPGTSSTHALYRRQITNSTQLTPIATSTATTSTTDSFFSATLQNVPPLPGVTAKLGVVWQPAFTTQNPALYMFGYAMSHTSIASNVGTAAPFEAIRSGDVTAVTSFTTVTIPVSPERELVTEANLGSTAIFPTTGQTVRFLMVNNTIAVTIAPVAQTYLAFDTLGFNVTR